MYILLLASLVYCAPLLSLEALGSSCRTFSYTLALEKEGIAQSFFPSKVSAIRRLAKELQEQSWPKEIQKFTSREMGGAFFKLPAHRAILYTPPFVEEYMIDKGAFKKVYKGLFFTRDGYEVVAACVGSRKAILHEVSFFRKIGDLLENPFLASFSLGEDTYLLVLRYYNVGSLRKLRDSNTHFDDQDKLTLARCLVNALMVLHKNEIAHRDIHDGNILLRTSPSGELRAGLIDFGRATSLSAKTETVPQGAPRRNPPEVILSSFRQVDKRRSDIYALGCSLYYIFFSKIYEGISLFDVKKVSSLTHQKKKQLFESVLKTHTSLYEKVQKELSDKAARGRSLSTVDRMKKCILLMVHPDPEKRIALEEVFHLLSSSKGMDHI